MSYKQSDMFNPAAAEAAKQAAVQQVEQNANRRWYVDALAAVYRLCRLGAPFTTDDIWLALLVSSEATHEPRALGAVMTTARKRRWCRPTDRYVPSARPECHGRPVRQWVGAPPLPRWTPADER